MDRNAFSTLLKLLFSPRASWRFVLSEAFYYDWLISFLVFMAATSIIFRFTGDIANNLSVCSSLLDAFSYFLFVWGGSCISALLGRALVCRGGNLRETLKVSLFSTLPYIFTFPFMLIPSLSLYRPLLTLLCMVWCGILFYTGMMQLRESPDDNRFLLGVSCVFVPWVAISALLPHFIWIYLVFGNFSFLFPV